AAPSGVRPLALGGSFGRPTITYAATSPYLRPRLQLASRAEYASAIEVIFQQGSIGRATSVVMTPSYLGAVPTVWDVTIPDVSAAGFDAGWGLQTGRRISWSVRTVGGSAYADFVGRPKDGVLIRYANRADTIAAGAVHSRVGRSLILDVQRARAQGEHFPRR